VAINGCDPISMYGLYEDDLVRKGDGWIFQNRVFRPIHWSLPGDFSEQVAGKAV